MNSHALIETIADDWSARTAGAALRAANASAVCGRCAESDLVAGVGAQVAHGVLHGLVAPIEEVLDAALDSYVHGEGAPGASWEARLDLVDSYRATLRSQARRVVSTAMQRTLLTA